MKLSRYISSLTCLLFMAAPAAAQSADIGLRLDRGDRMGHGRISVSDISVERQGGYVSVAMNIVLDSLDMPVNERFVYTPRLTSSRGAVDMPQIVINGRRQQIMYDRGHDNGINTAAATPPTIVTRRGGRPQTVSYRAVAPLAEGETAFDVWIREDLCGCGDSLGVRNYLLRRRVKPLLVFMRPEADPKMQHLDKTSYIDYPVDRTELYPDYRRNPVELDSIINTINAVKNDKNFTIRHIDIHGFASPESPYEHNDYLARERAKTLKDYVRRLVQLDDTVFSVSHTPENWDGLVSLINGGNLDNTQAILSIIADTTLTPDEREWKIKTTYPDDYRFMLTTWYPALRRSDYHVYYTIRPFTVDEAKQMIHTSPKLLSVEEMYLVAQTYTPGSAEFNDVMEIAVGIYPDDPTANLNAACSRLNSGDADGAKPYLDKAGNSPYAQNARAAYWQIKGDDDKARQLYRKAAEGGLQEAARNLDNL